jgi:hypothetical protein
MTNGRMTVNDRLRRMWKWLWPILRVTYQHFYRLMVENLSQDKQSLGKNKT